MQRFLLVFVLACLTATGCCGPGTGCVGKRETELISPTDIRKSHFWCWGEDAIFHYPSGPDAEFYGHRPTCWRSWPAEGPEWRDMHCGAPTDAACSPMINISDPYPPAYSQPHEEPMPTPMPMPRQIGPTFVPEPASVNPFRDEPSPGYTANPQPTRPTAKLWVSPPFDTASAAIPNRPEPVPSRPPESTRSTRESLAATPTAPQPQYQPPAAIAAPRRVRSVPKLPRVQPASYTVDSQASVEEQTLDALQHYMATKPKAGDER